MDDASRSAEWKGKYSLVAVIVALAVASVAYRVLAWQRLEHTSLVFIGIPAILAILIALWPSPKSATGAILRVMTLALLMSGVAFGEAFVCILFASPLFYAVGILVGLLVDLGRKGQERRMTLRTFLLLAAALTPASLEGVVPGFAFDREESVTVTRVVEATAGEVAASLAAAPRFDRGLPLFLRLGFPTPGATSGAGLEVGDRRSIQFVHGHHPGTLVVVVDRSEDARIDFTAIADDSYITHWLTWRRAEVSWHEIAPGRTEVSWTLKYWRRLDPAWYFDPLERFGAGQAAAYLIDTLATPEGR